MDIIIGAFDEATRSVPVTFTDGAIIHERSVRACVTENGAYDAAATASRVDEVARGVAVKIELGVIVVPPPAEDPAAPSLAPEPSTETQV